MAPVQLFIDLHGGEDEELFVFFGGSGRPEIFKARSRLGRTLTPEMKKEGLVSRGKRW